MNWPWVSRRAFDEVAMQRDELARKNDHLVDEMLKMRRDGFAIAKPAVVHQPEDEEAVGLRRAEQQLITRRNDAVFVARATKDIVEKTGVSESQARTEAIRLRRMVTDQEDSPT